MLDSIDKGTLKFQDNCLTCNNNCWGKNQYIAFGLLDIHKSQFICDNFSRNENKIKQLEELYNVEYLTPLI